MKEISSSGELGDSLGTGERERERERDRGQEVAEGATPAGIRPRGHHRCLD